MAKETKTTEKERVRQFSLSLTSLEEFVSNPGLLEEFIKQHKELPTTNAQITMAMAKGALKQQKLAV